MYTLDVATSQVCYIDPSHEREALCIVMVVNAFESYGTGLVERHEHHISSNFKRPLIIHNKSFI
jgi:hypothetical protein